jgi:hypothetical protein
LGHTNPVPMAPPKIKSRKLLKIRLGGSGRQWPKGLTGKDYSSKDSNRRPN